MAAVAACRAAEKVSGAELRIKWVNDLWPGMAARFAGILTEAALDMESGMLDYAVLGLGFNITAPSDGWPAELQDVAGTLFDDAPPPVPVRRWPPPSSTSSGRCTTACPSRSTCRNTEPARRCWARS